VCILSHRDAFFFAILDFINYTFHKIFSTTQDFNDKILTTMSQPIGAQKKKK